MASPPSKSIREDTTPFLLRLFYRAGALHRPEEFESRTLPPHIPVYTWSDCTLNELALEVAATKHSALPSPSVGCRLVFQLVFPDLRNATAVANSPPHYGVKDLGSVVLGGDSRTDIAGDVSADAKTRGSDDKLKTLSDSRFVVGDYITCAILPPLSDGSVAPVSSVRREQASGSHEARGSYRGRDNGFGRGGFRGGRGGWRDDVGGDFPMGEWRRGERLPDAPGRSRGRGRW
ncbi:Histone deacetylase complex subunit SAP18 [Fusarium austroafricanum]|uniref:Histone deacetylase complex subunit SAP18 n=1 Tax=Fusarium austroafricanum TaxID=2364996 RepID=A0A8H4KEJ5_9HYPO|nr:Histone deacetylase complex subunit SAP18 [Fusarium austroafricanum]